MILQQADGTITAQLLIITFFSGAIVVAMIVYGGRQFQKRYEALKLPIVIILDLSTYKMYNAGIFLNYTNEVLIPVEDQVDKQLWGIETTELLILPSFGYKEDMVIEDRNMQSLIIIICQIIGFSTDDEETHAEWAKDVFPPGYFEIPEKLKKLDNIYLFVRPFGPKNMVRNLMRQRLTNTRNLYSQLHKWMIMYEQEMETVHENYGQLYARIIRQTQNGYISMWQTTVGIYDTLIEERWTPVESMHRLLHIPKSKMTYSTLAASVTHGGLNEAASFVSQFTQALTSLSNAMGYIPVPASLQRAMAEKTNKLQGDLMSQRERNDQLLDVGRKLASQLATREDTSPPMPQEETQPQPQDQRQRGKGPALRI